MESVVSCEAKRIMRALHPFGQLASSTGKKSTVTADASLPMLRARGAPPLLKSLPAIALLCSPQRRRLSASANSRFSSKDKDCHEQKPTPAAGCVKDDPTWPTQASAGVKHPAITHLKEQIKELKSMPSIFSPDVSFMAANDIRYFRSPEYGRSQCSKELTDNLDFYQNKISSRPRGNLIDEIHSLWFRDYHMLEQHHGYIQWLFPLCEPGVNWEAQELQLPELEQMRQDPHIRRRVRKSYELMLDFYGFVLDNPSTGELKRSKNYRQQFMNLVVHSHNYLRITRILKFLGLMGMTHYQAGFLARFLEEMVCHGNLHPAASSLQHYWLPTLLDAEARAELERIVAKASVHDEASDSEDNSHSFSSWAGRLIPGRGKSE